MAASSNLVFDFTVVGAGVEGSATAYQLSKMVPGKRIALVEQFTVGHTRGSSTGGSRITRNAYSQSFYTAMMKECFSLWGELELESGREIYIPTGGLYFGPETSRTLWSVADSLKKQGVPHEVIDAEEANKRVPLLNLPPSYKCVMEKDAGVLKPPDALKAFQEQFVKNGGVLLENCKVEKIVPGTSVKLYTSKGVITTRHLIITAGPWNPQLLESIGLKLPLKVTRPDALYWAVKDERLDPSSQLPVFIFYDGGERTFDIYGLLVCEYPGLVKICEHGGIVVDPNSRDVVSGPSSVPVVAEFICKHFKNVDTKPSIFEKCMYTVTPDNDPVIDRHPLYRNILIGAGFSGHGFKLAPVVGKILSELALDQPPSYDLTPFSISRFTTKGKL